MRSFHNYIRYFTVTAIISSLVAFGSSAAYAVSGGDNIAQHERDKLLIYQHDMRKIEAYLNGLTTFVADFTQATEDGGLSKGRFYLSRPGMLRWEYHPPAEILIVAKDNLLAYYDKELDEISYISIDEALAGFLIKEQINFIDDMRVTAFHKKDDYIGITVTQQEKPQEGNITLVFNKDITSLVGMEVVDAVGKRTMISFDHIVHRKPLAKKLFDFPRKKRKRRTRS